jgi:hypothetical protein
LETVVRVWGAEFCSERWLTASELWLSRNAVVLIPTFRWHFFELLQDVCSDRLEEITGVFQALNPQNDALLNRSIIYFVRVFGTRQLAFFEDSSCFYWKWGVMKTIWLSKK